MSKIWLLLSIRNKLIPPPLYSALFYNVFKALNLFLNKYEAMAMALGCSPYHRGSTQSSGMAWHCWLTSQNVKNEGSCSWHYSIYRLQLSIFAQTLGMASPIKLPSQCKTCSPSFLKLIWARWQSGQYSSLEASVFCIAAAPVLHVSLTSEITRKKGGFRSHSHPYFIHCVFTKLGNTGLIRYQPYRTDHDTRRQCRIDYIDYRSKC